MAAPAGADFDQISLSSSCEIVDGPAEAVQDHQLTHSTQPFHTNLYPNLAHMDVAEEVMFTHMQDSYSMSRDLVVQYKYRNKKGGCYGDRVGLYKLPKTQPHEYLAYVWVSRGDGVATLDMSVLHEDEGEYLLQYIQGDNTVVGTSTTFQLVRDAENGVEESKPLAEENDKENNIVDEKCDEISVIDEKRCHEVETVLAAKAEEVKILTNRLLDEDVRFGKLSEEHRNLSKEKEEMSRILETEMERRTKLLDEKAELVEQCKDFSLQTKYANEDRDLAVEELRALIEQQDTLRKELAEYSEETGNAEAELISIKQEIAEINMRIKNENSMSFEDKIKDLAGNLEIHKKFLKEANGKIEKLEEDISEIHEEKVDLKLKLKELVTINNSMKEAVEMLEHEKLELEIRLSNISDGVNYVEDIEARGKICSLEEQVKVLNQQLMEARMISTMKNQHLAKFCSTAQKQARSNGASLEKSSAVSAKGDDIQEQNNPEKISSLARWFKGQVKGTGKSHNNQFQAQTSSTAPSLFQVFPPPAAAPVSVLTTPSIKVLPTPPSVPVLPAPPPVNPTTKAVLVLPTPSAPELPTPAASVPALPTYSLECPFCDDLFPGNQKELECHVEQHMEGTLECPICNLVFESRDQLLLETHVEVHFKSKDQELEELPLDARGWDLGID